MAHGVYLSEFHGAGSPRYTLPVSLYTIEYLLSSEFMTNYTILQKTRTHQPGGDLFVEQQRIHLNASI